MSLYLQFYGVPINGSGLRFFEFGSGFCPDPDPDKRTQIRITAPTCTTMYVWYSLTCSRSIISTVCPGKSEFYTSTVLQLPVACRKVTGTPVPTDQASVADPK